MHDSRTRERVIDLLVIGCASLVIALPNFPGRINSDTDSMLAQARSGNITNWHAPFIEILWRHVDRAIPPGGVFLLQTLFLVGSSFLVFRRVLARSAARMCVCVLWLNPLGYSFASQLTRDVWVVAGFAGALVGFDGLRRTRGTSRWAMTVYFATSIFLVVAGRQNGPALLGPLAFMLALNHVGRLRWLLATGAAATAMLVPILLSAPLNSALGVTAAGPEATVMLADLDAYSSYRGQVEVPASASSPGLTLADLESLSTIYVPDQLWFSGHPPTVYTMLPSPNRDEVKAAWVSMIKRDPIIWLKIRSNLFLRQVGLTGPTRGIFLPAEIANSVGIQPAFPVLAADATNWMLHTDSATSSLGRLVSRLWIWVVMAAVAVRALQRRGMPGAVVAASATFYALTLFPAATDLQYRFIAPSLLIYQALVLTGLAVELAAALEHRGKPRPLQSGVGPLV